MAKEHPVRTLCIGTQVHPMEAIQEDRLPTGNGWQYEPKWDGFRCLAFREGDCVDLRAKSGKPLGRYFPEIVAALRSLDVGTFVIDGELVIPVGGTLSFEALQLRLHPAESRVNRLANETPARLVLFDMLVDGDGRSLVEEPLSERRRSLEAFFERAGNPSLRLSPVTHQRAQAQTWLAKVGSAIDGVVSKRLASPYAPGERTMIKVKRLRTADCVVGGFRYETKGRLVGSILLGLYDDAGRLDHVGFTSGISDAERPKLTARLEALRGGPGFTGRAPGGPSRWSTERSGEYEPLRHELVVEVRYDHVTGDRFRHGTALVRWRPDKAPDQCRLDQLGRELRPARLIKAVMEA